MPVAGVDGIPAGNPVAMIANVTAVSGTSFTYFTLYPSDVTQPNASDLNVGPGQITPNLVIVQLATTGGQAGNANLLTLPARSTPSWTSRGTSSLHRQRP